MDNKLNNFDGVRLILAFLVIFAHLPGLTQIDTFNFLRVLLDTTFPVKGFFAISGFLIMKSYTTSYKNLSGLKVYQDFFKKRFFRIFPAYFGVILFCMVIGAYTSSLGLFDFIQSYETVRYLFYNIIFLNFMQHTLPMALENNAHQFLNGSLWTIKIEIMLYCCIPLIFYLFRKLGSGIISLIIFFVSVVWVYFFNSMYDGAYAREISLQFPGQLSYFIFGAYFFINKNLLLKVKWISIISSICFLLTLESSINLIIEPIFFSSIVIFFSTQAYKNLRLGKYGDISYGIYLYHFPVIQLLVFIGLFELNKWLALVVTIAVTVLMAFLSWNFIEKRFLHKNSHYVKAASNN